MLRSLALSVTWLISFLIALGIGISIVALFIVVGEPLLSTERAAYLPLIGLPVGCVAGYWVGVRAYSLGKRKLSAHWPVGNTHASQQDSLREVDSSAAIGASAQDSIRVSVTSRQRQLIVLSAAIILFLGPILIMGNCSGWNEGSMKVANCAVDFPLARDFADFFYGIVLFSAFLVGLPILVYLLICILLLVRLHRALR